MIAATTAFASAARADESAGPTEPDVHPTPLWAAFQLVPSPEAVVYRGRLRFGLRWQVTPFLYSFGIHRGLSPIRWLVAEPIVRHGGSLELFVAPEFVDTGYRFSRDWFFRTGLRSYVPLLEHGETISGSIAASAVLHHGSDVGAGFEGGLYTLSGVFGLQVGHVPTRGIRLTTMTFSFRYF